jgi:hypothetical protein
MKGYCGYDCGRCAARSDDPAVRRRLVDGWRKIFGHQNYTAENVRCDGCKAGGRLADKSCQARPCAIGRKVESCAECPEFPCKKVAHLVGSREGMMTFVAPKIKGLTEEEYLLCVRQFESMPYLIRAMVKCGRLPKWALKTESANGSRKRRITRKGK